MLSAIFIWRFMTYYLLMLIGFVSVLAEGGMRFLEGEQRSDRAMERLDSVKNPLIQRLRALKNAGAARRSACSWWRARKLMRRGREPPHPRRGTV